jgi:site-specific recombinase XerC
MARNHLARCHAGDLPVVTAAEATELATFFRAELASASTAEVYARAFVRFLNGMAARGVAQLASLTTVVAADYFRDLAEQLAPATVKQHLAAVNRCLDALARVGTLPVNPVRSVRGPRWRRTQTAHPPLEDLSLTKMLRLIPDDLLGLRDRALITLLIYTGERISAVLGLDTSAT